MILVLLFVISLYLLSLYLTLTAFIFQCTNFISKVLEDRIYKFHGETKNLYYSNFLLTKADLEDCLRLLIIKESNLIYFWPILAYQLVNCNCIKFKVLDYYCDLFLSKIWKRIDQDLLLLFLRQEILAIPAKFLIGLKQLAKNGTLKYDYYVILNCGHFISWASIDQHGTFKELENYGKELLLQNKIRNKCRTCHQDICYFTVVNRNFLENVIRISDQETLVCPLTLKQLEGNDQILMLPCGHFSLLKPGIKWYLNELRCHYCNQKRAFLDFTRPFPMKRYRRLESNNDINITSALILPIQFYEILNYYKQLLIS